MTYPHWSYFPRNVAPPPWAVSLVGVVAAHESQISSVEVPAAEAERMTSDRVLSVLADQMELLGYEVERGKDAGSKIERPVLFGDEGQPSVKYEIDAFHDEIGIAVEVEAGRGAMGNADYRDIVRTSLIQDANYFVLMMPIAYRYMSGGKQQSKDAFVKTREQFSAIYASRRLVLPFAGVLLIGY